MDENKMLDCSKLNTTEVEAIKRGLKKFVDENTHKARYFGYVDKADLKVMNRVFHYTDTRSFLKGSAITAGVLWVGSKIKKKLKENKPEQEESSKKTEES